MAVKGIIPKKINVAKIKSNIIKVSEKQGSIVVNAYGRIVKTWLGDKPTFPIKTTIKNDNLITSIIASGGFGAQKMVFLDDGTKPHKIKVKNAPKLIFQTGYKRKTKARTIGSTSGGSFGPTVAALEVDHPGTEAGELSLTIANRREPFYVKSISKAATTGVT